MKQVFQADDGTIFETQAECEKYELKSELFNFVDSNIEAPYNDDVGYPVFDTQNVVDFIVTHYEKIGELLGKTKVEDDGWIVNTKISCGHPATLKADDYIEVVYSDGETAAGWVNDWDTRWDVAGTLKYIAKYRKVNK